MKLQFMRYVNDKSGQFYLTIYYRKKKRASILLLTTGEFRRHISSLRIHSVISPLGC